MHIAVDLRRDAPCQKWDVAQSGCRCSGNRDVMCKSHTNWLWENIVVSHPWDLWIFRYLDLWIYAAVFHAGRGDCSMQCDVR